MSFPVQEVYGVVMGKEARVDSYNAGPEVKRWMKSVSRGKMRGRGVKWLAFLAQGHTTAWAQMLALLLTKCVTLGKSLNLPVHQFLHKARLMTVPTSLSCYND